MVCNKINNRTFQLGRSANPGHFSTEGVPVILNILLSSSVSELPGKSAFKLTISTKMHPILQISMEVE